VHAAHIKTENGKYAYDAVSKNWQLKNMQLHMGGLHNIEK